jgi:hypothetical protein
VDALRVLARAGRVLGADSLSVRCVCLCVMSPTVKLTRLSPKLSLSLSLFSPPTPATSRLAGVLLVVLGAEVQTSRSLN